MNFKTYINQAWNDHGVKPKNVADGFKDAIKLIDSSDQVPQIIQIVTHVLGEHLGEWDRGIELLSDIEKSDFFKETDQLVIKRSKAHFELSSNKIDNLNNFSNSDQIRILSQTASAMAAHGKTEIGINYFNQALSLAEKGLPKDDPANRTLAITGNNLACDLEEKNNRSSNEKKLMVLSAKTARKYWEIAGTWEQVKIAEYRLAMTYVQAGDLDRAFTHAQTSIQMSHDNKAVARHFFFGYEALAFVEKAKGNQIGFKTALERMKEYFEKISDEDKAWCKSTLNKYI